MAAEHGVIDLGLYSDEPAGTSSSRAARYRTALRLAATFAAGVFLGGAGVNTLGHSREQQERNASVALIAIAAYGGGGGSANGFAHLNVQLELINAGPAPITVRSAQADKPGVTLRDTGQSRPLDPGGIGRIDVRLALECSVAFEKEPLSVRFSVNTNDNHVREVSYPVALVGGAWHELAERACAWTFLDRSGTVKPRSFTEAFRPL